MSIVFWYAVACGIIAAIMPGGVPLSMVLEIVLVYHLSVVHRIPFRRGELAVIWAILVLASFILMLIVEAVSIWFPGPGWVVKGAIAFGFVMGAGWLVDSYYAAEQRKLGRVTDERASADPGEAIVIEHAVSAEELSALDAMYAERSASGRPTSWRALVEELRKIRRLVEAGTVVQVEGVTLRTWQEFYDWAHGRYHMLEDGCDPWIGDDRS